jgi:hypothetical protein
MESSRSEMAEVVGYSIQPEAVAVPESLTEQVVVGMAEFLIEFRVTYKTKEAFVVALLSFHTTRFVYLTESVHDFHQISSTDCYSVQEYNRPRYVRHRHDNTHGPFVYM